MRETMKCVSHEQARQLLHNKFVVVLGDSIQRSVYKDIVLLLQKGEYLSTSQLRTKGEVSFENDCLVEGGRMGQMHNGVEYREVRQFRSSHHLVRFYFLTRIYSRYMQSILEDFRQDLKPDVVIINSCVWDISRYSPKWVEEYQENLHKFFVELIQILPQDTLVMWNLTMPLGKKISGGFLVPEIRHKAPQLRHDVIEANFYSGTLADAFGLDILDLHFQFRFSLQHRTKDGVHWNSLAHRKITSLVLQHAAAAWGVILPCPLTTVEHIDPTEQQQQDYENYAKRAVTQNWRPLVEPFWRPIQNNHFRVLPGLRMPHLARMGPMGPWPAPPTFVGRGAGGPVGNWPPNKRVAWGAASDPGYSYPPPANYFSTNKEMNQPGPHQSQEGEYNGYSKEFCEDAYHKLPHGYLSFEDGLLQQEQQHKGPAAHRRCPPLRDTPVDNVCYRPALPPAHRFHPYAPLIPSLPPPPPWAENQYVMRNHHNKRHYAPYTIKRPNHHLHRHY